MAGKPNEGFDMTVVRCAEGKETFEKIEEMELGMRLKS